MQGTVSFKLFALFPAFLFFIFQANAGTTLCSGIQLQTSSKTLLIPFSKNRTQVFAYLKKSGLHVTPDPMYQGTFMVNEPSGKSKLPVAYIEFSPSAKISIIENIISTETIGDAKNLIYKLAEQYRKQIGKNDEIRHNSSGSQYKIFTSCGKIEIQIILSVSYDSPKNQHYISIKTIL